jgi:hypothetical protein
MEANSKLSHCLLKARALASLRKVVHIFSKIMVTPQKALVTEMSQNHTKRYNTVSMPEGYAINDPRTSISLGSKLRIFLSRKFSDVLLKLRGP